MVAKDLEMDINNELVIKNGDFSVTESDQVHIENILKSNKGYWFENPLIGVGIINELNGSKTRQELKQTIRRQLVLDDYRVEEIFISNDFRISINAIRRT